MRRIFLTLAMVLVFSGCMTHNIQHYGTIDKSSKTVTVPPGAEGLKGRLKQVLADDGWKLVVYRGPSVTAGNVGENTKLEQYDTFNSRYRLIVNSYQYDLCLNFTPAIKYDVSFIDNKSGAEVFTINGRGCEAGAVEKFIDALRGKSGS